MNRNLHETQFGGPEGNVYTAPNGKSYTMDHHAGRVQALTPSGRSAGRMNHTGPYTSEPEQQTIGNIEVSSQHRGKGLATAMLDYARKDYPDLHHSRTLTDDGRGFAAATPRTWQPKLPLLPDMHRSNGPNGGERGSSPWSDTVNLKPKNRRAAMAAEASITEAVRLRDRPPVETGEQGKLF